MLFPNIACLRLLGEAGAVDVPVTVTDSEDEEVELIKMAVTVMNNVMSIL